MTTPVASSSLYQPQLHQEDVLDPIQSLFDGDMEADLDLEELSFAHTTYPTPATANRTATATSSGHSYGVPIGLQLSGNSPNNKCDNTNPSIRKSDMGGSGVSGNHNPFDSPSSTGINGINGIDDINGSVDISSRVSNLRNAMHALEGEGDNLKSHSQGLGRTGPNTPVEAKAEAETGAEVETETEAGAGADYKQAQTDSSV
jgi:hypothetical protein